MRISTDFGNAQQWAQTHFSGPQKGWSVRLVTRWLGRRVLRLLVEGVNMTA